MGWIGNSYYSKGYVSQADVDTPFCKTTDFLSQRRRGQVLDMLAPVNRTWRPGYSPLVNLDSDDDVLQPNYAVVKTIHPDQPPCSNGNYLSKNDFSKELSVSDYSVLYV